jgi:signal transduction histidine kinase
MFNAIDSVLDRVLARDSDLRAETADESRISKLTHKASRVLEMRALAGVAMYADLLLEGGLSEEEQKEFMQRIKSGADRLQWMLDALVKVSRLEVGAIRLAPVSENIGQTLSDAISGVAGAASKKIIKITVSDFADAPLCHDGRWTREALANVLENAVKYSAPSGEIRVSVEPLPLYTKVNVADRGLGVEKDERNLIFKRFYRGRNAKGSEGAGLGLYLAALIMEKQGGYIAVDSVPGEYTVFSLFLRNGAAV